MRTHNLLLLVILFLTLCKTLTSVKEITSYLSTKTYDVRIINGFTSNSSMPLVVWCASQEGDDMGGRALQEREDYGWSIDAGLFSRPSRFVCTAKWGWRRKKFEAFWLSRDKYRCGVRRRCFWLVKEDGIYFVKNNDNEGNWTRDFSWM
ncbi:uncharacterized protein [Primulina eburnea]|uniref:uncharacterized protein n=1 Tax=Primulina eburnea TaxID=1245227 RepID=UPI003C6C1A6D